MRKVLFLDRDGTVNREKNYLYRPEEFEFVPGILELCLGAHLKGYDIVIITNQSGIARGYYTEGDYEVLTRHMVDLFSANGIDILAVFHCPYLQHPDRKPEPGMFLKAKEQYHIDMPSSISLGDKERDVDAAIRAGVGHNYLLAANKQETRANAIVTHPDDVLAFIR